MPDAIGVAASTPARSAWPALSLFAVVYALFIALPAILDGQFPPRTDLLWGDVLDFATPLAVFGALYLLVRDADAHRDPALLVGLGCLAILWAQGHGMHLAANAIHHHLEADEGAAAVLAEFLDETLSHYLWYAAVVAMPGFLLLVTARARDARQAEPGTESPAAVLFGLVLGFSILEADVIPLALPALLGTLVAAAAWIRRDRAPFRHPLGRFAVSSTAVALVVLVGWAIGHGGWPEPSDVGLI